MEQIEKRGKADIAEHDKRVNEVYLMLLQGFVRKQIIQYASENYKIGERSTDDYIRKARELFKSNLETETESKKFQILTQYYDLYNKNYKEEDFRECRNILKDISVVLGIEAPKKIDHTTDGQAINQPPIFARNPLTDE